MTKDPSFQWYASDWLGSNRRAMMTLEQQGAYLNLLCRQWTDKTCSLPDDDTALAALSGMGEGWFNGGSTVVRLGFPPHPTLEGRVANERLLKLRAERDEWLEKSRRGGIKSGETRRLRSAKGGSTTLPTKRQPNANTPSPSPSPSVNAKPLPLSGAVCVYCGVKQSKVDWAFDLDHFIPVAAGGTDDPSNLVSSCHVCNQIKQKRIFETIDDARQHIHWKLWVSGRKRYAEYRRLCFGGLQPTGEKPSTVGNGSGPLGDSGKPLPPLPDSLSEMAEDWAKWVQFRKEKRAPVTPTMAASQFEQFEEWGIHRARAAITHTIRKGWQGLREPDDSGNGQSEKPKFTMLSDLDGPE